MRTMEEKVEQEDVVKDEDDAAADDDDDDDDDDDNDDVDADDVEKEDRFQDLQGHGLRFERHSNISQEQLETLAKEVSKSNLRQYGQGE